MLNSGTASHVTPSENLVQSVTECEVEIHLVDDSTVSTKKQSTESASYLKNQSCKKLNLSETLIAPHLSISLLSLQALTRKDIAALFTPEVATMFNFNDS